MIVNRFARLLQLAFAFVLVAQLFPTPLLEGAQAAPVTGPATTFGAAGSAQFANYQWDGSFGQGQEPSIGIGWNQPGGFDAQGVSDVGTTVMYQASADVYRLQFDDSVSPPALLSGNPGACPTKAGCAALVPATVPDDVSDPNSVNNAVGDFDAIMYTDHQLGRTWAGGLQITNSPGGYPCPFFAGGAYVTPTIGGTYAGCTCPPSAPPAPPAAPNCGVVCSGVAPLAFCTATCMGTAPATAPALPPGPPVPWPAGSGPCGVCSPRATPGTPAVGPVPGTPASTPCVPTTPGAPPPAVDSAVKSAMTVVPLTGCAVMELSDDNGGGTRYYYGGFGGATNPQNDVNAVSPDWTQTTDSCSLPGWDHESIGSGPYPVSFHPTLPTSAGHVGTVSGAVNSVGGPGTAPYTNDLGPLWPHAVYYCSQTGGQGGMSCWTSEDGGMTFCGGITGPACADRSVGVPDPSGICGGLHGHIKVAPDGSAYLPNKNCDGYTGFAVTTDFGATWSIRVLPYPNSGTGAHDPSIGVSEDHGWVYVGQGEANCACIAMSKDGGLSWEDMGTGNGAAAGTKYFNVGTLVPGLKRYEFAEVVAGDDDRAAFAFLGGTGTGPGGVCTSALTWKLYVAFTYDEGKTWSVSNADPNISQRGGIWPSGGGSPCRNLLDFNDATIDTYGRVVVGYSDGCTGRCPAGGPTSDNARSTVARQYTGCGLFEKYDVKPSRCRSQAAPTNLCGRLEAPIVDFSQPFEGQVVDTSVANVTGYVNLFRVDPPIFSIPHGPYNGSVFDPIAIQGDSSCGTGNGAPGTFSCTWAALGGNPVFSGGDGLCTTSLTYQVAGTFPLQLEVRDHVTNRTDTQTTFVTVRPASAGVVLPPVVGPPASAANCVDNMTIAGAPAGDAESDSDSTGPTGDAEIMDVCAKESPTALTIDIRADLTNSRKGLPSLVDYMLYLDTSNTLATPADPTLLVSDSASGGFAYDPAGNAVDPGVLVTYSGEGTVTGHIRVVIPLPSPYLPNAGSSASPPVPHTVHVDIPRFPVYLFPNAPTGAQVDTSGITPNSQGVYVNDGPLNINCCRDSAPDVGMLAASCAGCAGKPMPVRPTILTPPSVAGVAVPATAPVVAGLPIGAITSAVVPPVGAAATSVLGTVGSATTAATGAVNSAVSGAASGYSGPAAGVVGAVPGVVSGVTGEVNTVSGALSAAKLASMLSPGGTTMAGSGVSSTAATSAVPPEYVKVHFDWGLDAYQPVDTHTRPGIDADVFGFQLVGLTPSLNGVHRATAEWYANGDEFMASANVTFILDLGTPMVPLPEAAGSSTPRDSPYAGWLTEDHDHDGILNGVDNCPETPNPLQEDMDKDGVGDVCDLDADGDIIPNALDNCPLTPNGDQRISHYPNPHGIGDACNRDNDGDGIPNVRDDCPDVFDPAQLDSNNNGKGDFCETAATQVVQGGSIDMGSLAKAPRATGDARSIAAAVPESHAASIIDGPALYAMIGGGGLLLVMVIVFLTRKPT